MNINHQLDEDVDSTNIFYNLTETKFVEETLRSTKNLYHSIVETQTELICRFWPDGTLTFINKAFCEYFGKSSQETIGKNVLMFFAEIDRENAKQHLLSPDKDYAIKTYEYQSIGPNGEMRWQQWFIQALFDQKSHLVEFQSVGRDITQLKQTQEALRQSQERWQGMLQSLDDVVWSIDATTGKTLYISPAAQQIYGRPISEFLNNSKLWQEVIHPKDRHQVERQIPILFATGMLHLEYRIVRPSGEIRWLHARMRSTRDGIDGIATDITERKQAQEELEASKELFRLLLEGVKDYAIYMLDKNGCVVSWNAGAEKIYGFKTREIIGQHFSGFFRSEDVRSQEPVKELKMAISEGKCEVEGWRVRSDGSQFWAQVAISTLHDDMGKLRGFAKVTRDITDRKKAEEETRRTQLFLNSIVENIPDTIFVKDAKDLKFIRFNKAGENLLGYPREELIGKTDRELFSPEDAELFINADREVLANNKLLDIPEETIHTRHNGVRILHTKKLPISDKNGEIKYILGISEDITERKRVEKKLRQQKEILQTIFDRIPVMVTFLNSAGKIKLINSELERLLGWSFKELKSVDWLEESYPDPEYRQWVLDCIMTANGKWQDMKTRTKDGRIIDTAWANIQLSNGSRIGIGQDITERKKSEEALRQAYSDLRDREEQYRILTTHAPVGIFQTNAQGEINFVNQRWCQIVGISPEEAYGNSWMQALHLDRKKRNLLEKRHLENQQKNCWEIRFQAANGKMVWVIVNTAPLHDVEENCGGIIGTILDITDRKITEKALRKSEAKFQKLAANLPGMIYQFTLGWDGSISFPYVSAGCREIYELEPEEIQRNPTIIIDIIHPEDKEKFEESVIISAKTLEAWRWEGRIVVKGKIKWLQGAARPERKGNGDILWDGLIFDISDRKKAELRLATINECFLKFGSNPSENINSLTALCGELLGSASAFYTGLEGETLKTLGEWHRYFDRTLENPELTVCYDGIETAGNHIFRVGNLPSNLYFENNLKIASNQKMQTYFGWTVKCENTPIGALCAVYKKTFTPNEDDEKVMGIIAAAIGVEEERRRVEEALRLQTQQERLIGSIAHRIRQTLNLDDILNTTVDEVLQLLQCDRVSIFRLYPDGTGKIITEAVKSGWPATLGETFPNQCFPPEYYQSYCQGNPRAITDIANDSMTDCLLEYLQKVGVKSKLVVPILQHEMLWGLSIAHQCTKPRQWQKSEIDLLASLATQVGIAIQQSELYQQLEQAYQELHRLATVDGLTQVANRRRFDEYLGQEWRRLAREQAPLSLILCDVDFFKLYNDTYGHQAGDECLKQVARAIENTVKRPADLVARYGGEEFTVILPNTDRTGAACVAEEIRIAIKALQIPHSASSVSSYVTISLGVSTLIPSPVFSPEIAIEAADLALYHAKKQGRDNYQLGIEKKISPITND